MYYWEKQMFSHSHLSKELQQFIVENGVSTVTGVLSAVAVLGFPFKFAAAVFSMWSSPWSYCSGWYLIIFRIFILFCWRFCCFWGHDNVDIPFIPGVSIIVGVLLFIYAGMPMPDWLSWLPAKMPMPDLPFSGIPGFRHSLLVIQTVFYSAYIHPSFSRRGLLVLRLPKRGSNDNRRGPRFRAVVMIWLQARPLLPVSKLTLFLSLPVCRRSSFLTGEKGRRGQVGSRIIDRKKAWASLNRSILSGLPTQQAEPLWHKVNK